MTGEFNVAVHALVYLAHKKCIVSSEGLAENICTHPSLVRRVMARLRKAGIVETHEGVEGGYCLTRADAEITLCEVLRAVGAKPVDVRWRSGSADMECLVASGMAGVMEQVYADMNERCEAYLAQITVGQIVARLFDEMKGNAV